jgi:hypothetical protein
MRLLLITTTAVLLLNAVAISRDYQDSWVLEGLEIPFILFVVTFSLAFFSEKKESVLVGLAVGVRIVFLLIPNLKYVWFQGVYIDQNQQYGLARNVVATGSISTYTSNPSFSFYIASPLLHLLFSTFSIVLNVPVADSMKYVPVLLSPIYPLLTFAIVKKMGFMQENTILKYALFLSAIPISSAQYVVTGTLFGISLAFIILYLIVTMLQKNDRRYWIVCIILVTALAATHSVTSVILMGSLLLILALERVPYLRTKYRTRSLRVPVALTVTAIGLTWLIFRAGSTFQEILVEIFLGVPTGTTAKSEYIPSTFFRLVDADILAAVKTFLVYYGADFILLILTLVGVILMLRLTKKLNSVENFLLLFCGLVLLIIPIGVFLKLGATRALSFAELMFPIFSGIAIFYLSKKGKWASFCVFALIMLLLPLQSYGCQPLIPSANVIYKELPSSTPIGYATDVYSIYQRKVISYTVSYVTSGRIACDQITYNQIAGIADYDFLDAHLIFYYPIDKQQPQQAYDLFIIHVPGRAGILQEKAPVRTPDLILQTIHDSGVVYTNGESYILAHNYPQP